MSFTSALNSTYRVLGDRFHKHDTTSQTFVSCDLAVHELLNVLGLDLLVCAFHKVGSWELFALSADCECSGFWVALRYIHCYSNYTGICDGWVVEKQRL